jgi:hypothetical protein
MRPAATCPLLVLQPQKDFAERPRVGLPGQCLDRLGVKRELILRQRLQQLRRCLRAFHRDRGPRRNRRHHRGGCHQCRLDGVAAAGDIGQQHADAGHLAGFAKFGQVLLQQPELLATGRGVKALAVDQATAPGVAEACPVASSLNRLGRLCNRCPSMPLSGIPSHSRNARLWWSTRWLLSTCASITGITSSDVDGAVRLAAACSARAQARFARQPLANPRQLRRAPRDQPSARADRLATDSTAATRMPLRNVAHSRLSQVRYIVASSAPSIRIAAAAPA